MVQKTVYMKNKKSTSKVEIRQDKCYINEKPLICNCFMDIKNCAHKSSKHHLELAKSETEIVCPTCKKTIPVTDSE